MLSVIGALLAAAALALLFPGTRWFGIACIVLLCYLSPVFAAFLVVLIVVFVLYLFK